MPAASTKPAKRKKSITEEWKVSKKLAKPASLDNEPLNNHEKRATPEKESTNEHEISGSHDNEPGNSAKEIRLVFKKISSKKRRIRKVKLGKKAESKAEQANCVKNNLRRIHESWQVAKPADIKLKSPETSDNNVPVEGPPTAAVDQPSSAVVAAAGTDLRVNPFFAMDDADYQMLGTIFKTGYESLKKGHETLKTGYETLKTGHETLKTGDGTLKTSHEKFKTGYETFKTGYQTLKTGYETLVYAKGEFYLWGV